MGIKCNLCLGKCARNGYQYDGKQRYKCISCGKNQQICYTYNACKPSIDAQIIVLTKEGVGVRSSARILKISTATLLKRLVTIAGKIPCPIISKGKTYEVDEMRTFLKRKDKLIWIVYALERSTKKVVSFNVGKRTNRTLSSVTQSLELSGAKKYIRTDCEIIDFLLPKICTALQGLGLTILKEKIFRCEPT